jgi:hypothetical protein
MNLHRDDIQWEKKSKLESSSSLCLHWHLRISINHILITLDILISIFHLQMALDFYDVTATTEFQTYSMDGYFQLKAFGNKAKFSALINNFNLITSLPSTLILHFFRQYI